MNRRGEEERKRDLVPPALTSFGGGGDGESYYALYHAAVPSDGVGWAARSSTAPVTDHQGDASGKLMYQICTATIQSVIIIVLQASMILYNYILPGREQEIHIQPLLNYLLTCHCKLNLTPM